MSRPVPELFDLVTGRPVRCGPGLVASATEHGLAGVVLSAADRGDLDLAPTDALTLTAFDATVVARQRRLWTCLSDLVTRLASVGIDAYAIKGVTNEARWYGRLGERPSTDVDLVLADHHLGRFDEALEVLGPDLPDRRAAVALVAARRLQHVHFVHDGVAVDLHLDPLKLGTWTRHPERLWETTVAVEGPDGTVVPALAAAPALALALIHLNKDRFAYLGGYAEVARILTDASLDPDELDRFAVGEGLEVPVRSALAEVVDRLGLAVDAPAPTGPAAAAWRALWPRSAMLAGHDARDVHRFRQSLLPHIGMSRKRDGAAELRRRLVPPRPLLDLHRPELADHGYLRRVTVDRLPTGRLPLHLLPTERLRPDRSALNPSSGAPAGPDDPDGGERRRR